MARKELLHIVRDPQSLMAALTQPLLVLHMEKGKIRNPADLARSPDWAKPIVAAALKLDLK